jgi:Na+-translocating ferredoxin:NAD+ oxidoreductase RnfC subunit
MVRVLSLDGGGIIAQHWVWVQVGTTINQEVTARNYGNLGCSMVGMG